MDVTPVGCSKIYNTNCILLKPSVVRQVAQSMNFTNESVYSTSDNTVIEAVCLSVCLFVSVIVLCAIFECRIKFRAALLYLFVLCVCLPVCLNGVDGRKPL